MNANPMFPRGYTGDEDAAKMYDDMLPKAGGVGAGTLVAKARNNGAFASDPQEVFAAYLNGLAAEAATDAGVVGDASAAWTFGLYDPEADAKLPPVTYRDALKLWPNSPGKIVSQVIAGPKQHKTNWIMAELFRLAIAGIRHDR